MFTNNNNSAHTHEGKKSSGDTTQTIYMHRWRTKEKYNQSAVPSRRPGFGDILTKVQPCCAVIDHEESKKESIEEGHYTISMKAGKTWIRFNDQILSTVHPRNLVTPHAYILVYCQDKLYSDLISDDNERVSYPDYFIEAQQAKVGNETAIGNEDEVLNFPTRQKKR